MEARIILDNLDGIAMANDDEEVKPLVITATDEFQDSDSNKGYIAFNIEIGSKAARFLALKSDVREFFESLKKNV
jgi:hypothetical protein